MTRWSQVLTVEGATASASTGRTRSRRRRRRMAAAAGLAVALIGGGTALAAGTYGTNKVGPQADGSVLLPSSQRLTPYGARFVVNNGRLLSSTISPDGTKLAALTWQNSKGYLTILDLRTGRVVQQVGTGAAGDPKLGDGTVAADGPLYSRDGRTLYFPQTADLLKFTVNADGTVVRTPAALPLAGSTPKIPGPNGAYLPSGMALSSDGRTLYTALNGVNALGVIDTASFTLKAKIPVGVAPRQVVLTGGLAFVSNEGGRPTTPADPSTNLTDGTPVVADPSTGAVTNGTVSVVDVARGVQTNSIKVGLQPTALTLSGNTLFVANSNDDSMSLIDVGAQKVAATVNVNPLPGSTVGSYPDAIAVPDPQHVIVSIGRDNALAVYRFNGTYSPMQYEGLIPTDWYPLNVQFDAALGRLIVTNDKGVGARGAPSTITEGPDANPATGHNTYDDTGTVTAFAPPTEAALAGLTHAVFVNNDWQKLLSQPVSAARSTAAPVAIPRQLGDPSLIKHVFLIIKENRTYDQVLGDIGKGNSDPTKTQFGYSVTPNLHGLANTFTLFDNFYDEGTLSADGHNWLMQADANDYLEREFGAFYRSYPAQGADALAYQRDGFLWNAAQRAGKTVQNFGEYNNFFTADNDPNRPTWSQWYQDAQILQGKASGPLPVPIDKYTTYADIPSLNAITDHTYPKFDLTVPDQYRTDIWLKSFKQSEQTGNLANLTMMWVPDDHTAGTSGATPFPTAAVADNDLAVGRIIDNISHSPFWPSSAVFVLEDDTQNGTDHVDGHRAPVYIASPYAKRGVVNDDYYTQLNLVKTIEQILGVAPMNQEDRAAEPMYDAFNDYANTQPVTVRPNQIPLTYGLKTSAATSPGSVPSSVPAAARTVFQQWQVWSAHQPAFSGSSSAQDSVNPAQLNHLDWYASTGWTKPYPGEKTILGPYAVPGWDQPAAEIGD